MNDDVKHWIACFTAITMIVIAIVIGSAWYSVHWVQQGCFQTAFLPTGTTSVTILSDCRPR